MDSSESDVNKDLSPDHGKTHATQSQVQKKIESQPGSKIFPAKQTIPCYVRNTGHLKNATKSGEFLLGKRFKICFKLTRRQPATRIQDRRSTYRSVTLKRKLLQPRDVEIDNKDLQPANTEEDQSGEEVEETNSKSLLRPKKDSRKSASKAFVQTSFQNALNELKLQLKVEKKV